MNANNNTQFAFATANNSGTMSGGAQGSLKNKLTGLEELIRQVSDEINYSKREVQMLRQEKEQLEGVLSNKSIEVRKSLQVEAQRVEDELKRNLSMQKTENLKL